MSKVFSFRLNKENSRESQAIDVIKACLSQGYSLRYILTEALIHFGKKGNSADLLEDVYEQLSNLIRELGNGSSNQALKAVEKPLSPDFIGAMKKAVKKGIGNS